jgi:predicted ArsR family transcriptional regulator
MGKKQSSTRDVVLRTIKSVNGATVDVLAEAAGVSPVTVRHHVNGLLADGLIESESVRRNVGRPYHIYHLSEAGQELFPKKYFALSNRLLDELKVRFSAEIVNDLFQSLVQKIIDEHRPEFEPLDFEGRLNYLMRLLADEGFLARWEHRGNGYRITEYSCPFLNMGQTHAEVCTLDTALIQAVLETEIEQHSCMLNGDDCCQFELLPNRATIALPEVLVQ